MSKLTLLEITQDILSDMNDDNVNSISDTEESLQVSQIIKSVYFEMMANKNWPHLREITQLDGLSDTTRPNYLKLDEKVKELVSIQYNNIKATGQDNYTEMRWVDPDEFLRKTSEYNSLKPDTAKIVDTSGVTILIKTKQDPEFYTSFDDELLVFNSFNSDKDSTLHKDKTRAVVYKSPVWATEDTFIPDLPEEAFPALLAESKSVCFTRIKQVPDAKSEQQSTRQRNWLSRKAFTTGGGIRYQDYGRKV